MEINWLGHSSVSINSRDLILITDPFDSSEGTFMTPQKADIVTVSHDDIKHSSVESISGEPRIIDGPGEYEINNFYITGLGTAFNTDQNAPRQINTVYTIKAEGLALCHIGSLAQKLSPSQIDQIGQIDILFTPVTPAEDEDNTTVTETITSLQPRIVIPIQYSLGASTEDLPNPDKFFDAIGATEKVPQNRLVVTETNLPAETTPFLLNRQ
tara:strand:+ start:17 stop:652 length:636 start_codon:yes stop_codon:yes gene_type:complete